MCHFQGQNRQPTSHAAAKIDGYSGSCVKQSSTSGFLRQLPYFRSRVDQCSVSPQIDGGTRCHQSRGRGSQKRRGSTYPTPLDITLSKIERQMQLMQCATHEMYGREPMQAMPIRWEGLRLPVGFGGEDHDLSSDISRLTGK